MEQTMTILATLNDTVERYNALQVKFNEFCAQILNTQKIDDRLSIFTAEQTENILLIGFLDRKIEVTYLFSTTDEGSRKGHIQCSLLSPTLNNEPLIIEKIGFNGTGTADIPAKDNGDKYEIQNREDAINILVNWISLSLNEKLLTKSST